MKKSGKKTAQRKKKQNGGFGAMLGMLAPMLAQAAMPMLGKLFGGGSAPVRRRRIGAGSTTRAQKK